MLQIGHGACDDGSHVKPPNPSSHHAALAEDWYGRSKLKVKTVAFRIPNTTTSSLR